jgi:hypothetical protein
VALLPQAPKLLVANVVGEGERLDTLVARHVPHLHCLVGRGGDAPDRVVIVPAPARSTAPAQAPTSKVHHSPILRWRQFFSRVQGRRNVLLRRSAARPRADRHWPRGSGMQLLGVDFGLLFFGLEMEKKKKKKKKKKELEIGKKW